MTLLLPLDRPDARSMQSSYPTVDSSVGTGLVVGIVAPGWRIEHITVDQHGLVGVPTADLIGASLLTHVHPGDIAALEPAVDHAVADGANVSLDLQMGRTGRWSAVRMVITPIVNDGGRGFGIAISGIGEVHPSRADHAARAAPPADRPRGAGRWHPHPGRRPPPRPSATPYVKELSPRQQEVLRRLLQGERVPGIARNLFLSPSTVRNHLTAIFAKLGVHSQEELIQLLHVHPSAAPPPGVKARRAPNERRVQPQVTPRPCRERRCPPIPLPWSDP